MLPNFHSLPFVAREKVNVLLLDKVGTGLLSETPALVAAKGRLRWRVSAVFLLPRRGRLAKSGPLM